MIVFIFFVIIKIIVGFRVFEEEEIEGFDVVEYGVIVYSDFVMKF